MINNLFLITLQRYGARKLLKKQGDKTLKGKR